MTTPPFIKQKVAEFMKNTPCVDSHCDLNGNIPYPVDDSNWEAEQCRFCFEYRFPIHDRLTQALTDAYNEGRRDALEEPVEMPGMEGTLEALHKLKIR